MHYSDDMQQSKRHNEITSRIFIISIEERHKRALKHHLPLDKITGNGLVPA